MGLIDVRQKMIVLVKRNMRFNVRSHVWTPGRVSSVLGEQPLEAALIRRRARRTDIIRIEVKHAMA